MIKKSKCSSQKGQIFVEMVLILALFVGLTYIVLNVFKQKKPFVAFVTTPWQIIGGMMESGNWQKLDEAKQNHPNRWKRMYSLQGKNP